MSAFRGGEGGEGREAAGWQWSKWLRPRSSIWYRLGAPKSVGVGENVGKSQVVGRSNVVCFALKHGYQPGQRTLRLETPQTLYKLASKIGSLNGILVSIYSAPGRPTIGPFGSSHP